MRSIPTYGEGCTSTPSVCLDQAGQNHFSSGSTHFCLNAVLFPEAFANFVPLYSLPFPLNCRRYSRPCTSKVRFHRLVALCVNTDKLETLTEHANLKEDNAGGSDWSSAFSIRPPPPAQFMAVERQQLPDWPCNGFIPHHRIIVRKYPAVVACMNSET